MKISIVFVILLAVLSQVAVIKPAQAQTVAGNVNANGTSQTPTNAFTISHPSTGRYIITFAPGVFTRTFPVCIVMPLSAVVSSIFQNFSNCDVTISDLEGNLFDDVFNFIAAPLTESR